MAMRILDALVMLHALESFRRLPPAKDGRPYGPGFFGKRDWLGTLSDENRRVSMRLARTSSCTACGAALSPDSTGDHLIPLAEGGPDGAQNYLPLCRSCNSSKGKRDFVEWWVARGASATTLSSDVLIAYARLKYAACSERGTLEADAPAALETFVEQLIADLPTHGHRAAVRALPRRF